MVQDLLVAMAALCLGALSGVVIITHLTVGIAAWNTAGDNMVVEHKGFRSRWIISAAAVSVSDLQDVDSAGPTTDPDSSWEQVESPDTENLFGKFDNTDTLDSSMEALDRLDVLPLQEPRFIHPKPKSVATKPASLSAESLAVKCIADELASRHVHKSTSDLKQPWQKGHLTCFVFQAETVLGSIAVISTVAVSWNC